MSRPRPSGGAVTLIGVYGRPRGAQPGCRILGPGGRRGGVCPTPSCTAVRTFGPRACGRGRARPPPPPHQVSISDLGSRCLGRHRRLCQSMEEIYTRGSCFGTSSMSEAKPVQLYIYIYIYIYSSSTKSTYIFVYIHIFVDTGCCESFAGTVTVCLHPPHLCTYIYIYTCIFFVDTLNASFRVPGCYESFADTGTVRHRIIYIVTRMNGVFIYITRSPLSLSAASRSMLASCLLRHVVHMRRCGKRHIPAHVALRRCM